MPRFAPSRQGLSGRTRTGWRAVELVLVFVGLPLAYRAGLFPAPMLAVLDAVALACAAVLLFDSAFDRRRLGGAGAVRGELAGIALRGMAAAAVIVLTVVALDPSALLGLPRRHLDRWARLVVVYPVLSAWPQELLYRTYFFHRYRPLFGGGHALVAASTAAFSFLHVVFPNLVAIALTIPAGLVLGWTYRRTGSLVVVTVEHALYGVLVFTLGLARYFL
jgi:membrane protease YdiL (CAAX protease family)